MEARAVLVAAITVAAISVAACSAPKTNDNANGGAIEIGKAVPSYATVSLDGDSVSLADVRGRVVLVNIWATWCHPCREEIPQLAALHERFRERGFSVIGVSVDTDGTDDAIRAFMRDYPMPFPVWRDPDERISSLFLALGVPATFLIDAQGILRWRKTGPITRGDTALTAAIQQALGS